MVLVYFLFLTEDVPSLLVADFDTNEFFSIDLNTGDAQPLFKDSASSMPKFVYYTEESIFWGGDYGGFYTANINGGPDNGAFNETGK